MMIIDELDMFPKKYVMSTLVPIITGQEKTIIIGMTTRNTDSTKSWIDGFVDYKDNNGNNLVKSVNIERVCKDCLKKGGEYILTCNHVNLSITMRSSEKEDSFKNWMISSGGEDAVRTELLGVKSSRDNLAFDPKYIDIMFKSFYTWNPETYVTFDFSDKQRGFTKCIVTVDPNAGGPNRAGISITLHDPEVDLYVIFSVRGENCKTFDELMSFFFKTISNFNQEYPKLKHIKKYVFIESNGRFDGGAFADKYNNLSVEWFRRVGKLMFAGQGKKYGVNKTGPNSIQYIKDMASTMAMSKIKFCDKFAKNPMNQKTISELRNQIENFPIVKSDVYRKLKATGQMNDDELITVVMAIYWLREMLHSYDRLFEKWNSIS